MDIIPYGKHEIEKEDIQAVVDTLQSDFLTQGPKITEFEENFAAYTGADFAIAVSNGTAALHLCAIALGVKAGVKVLTSPITFVASANCILYAGGEVDFVDIDPHSYLIDLHKLENKLSKAKPGEYSGIIPIDFAGYPVNLEELKNIAKKYNLWILEDACHAPGGAFKDSMNRYQYCGNGNYSDLAIFSFHPVKHIATGEGGMITTNNKDLYEKLLSLRTHGIIKHTDLLEDYHGGWYYEMQNLGYNYRLSDIQASLGISQLRKIHKNIKRRREIAEVYNNGLRSLNITLPIVAEGNQHAYHLYIIQTKERKELYDYLRANNIFTQVHYIPVHMQPYYRRKGWKIGDLPSAEDYYSRCLSLPMYPSLTANEQDYIIEKIKAFFHE